MIFTAYPGDPDIPESCPANDDCAHDWQLHGASADGTVWRICRSCPADLYQLANGTRILYEHAPRWDDAADIAY